MQEILGILGIERNRRVERNVTFWRNVRIDRIVRIMRNVWRKRIMSIENYADG